MTDRYGWGGKVQLGSPVISTDMPITYTAKNQRNNFSYDAAGNLTNDLGQTFAYDVTGQQTSASYTGYSLNQCYDGDGLREEDREWNDDDLVFAFYRPWRTSRRGRQQQWLLAIKSCM